jgi:hypothetical protein
MVASHFYLPALASHVPVSSGPTCKNRQLARASYPAGTTCAGLPNRKLERARGARGQQHCC